MALERESGVAAGTFCIGCALFTPIRTGLALASHLVIEPTSRTSLDTSAILQVMRGFTLGTLGCQRSLGHD